MALRGKRPTTTRAAVLVEIGKPLSLRELTLPKKLVPGQVLVKVQMAGLCRTQLNEIEGLKGEDKYLPHLLGHEAVGYVIEIGAGVKTVKRGDYVVLSWLKGKGKDAPGGPYFDADQKVNAGGVAVFTEYAVVAENRVTKISKTVPPEIVALLGCAVATGAGIIKNLLQIKKGQSVAIFGVGGIGGSALLMAALTSCKKIIAVDIDQQKLTWAKKLGATHTIRADKTNSAVAIKKLLPAGVDFAVEASGIPSVMETAFASIKDGGALGIAGHPAHGATISIDPFELIKGKRLLGTWGGQTVPEKDFSFYIRAWQAGKFPIEKLISRRFALKDINQALTVLKAGGVGRIIIDCQ